MTGMLAATISESAVATTAVATSIIAVASLIGLLWRIARKIDRVVEVAEAMPSFMEGAREEFRLIWWVLGKSGVERPQESPFPTVVNIWRADEHVHGTKLG